MTPLCYLFIFLPSLLAAPMPPRVPPLSERLSVKYHMKEDSPFNCSRAVSRWVREAWAAVANDALKTTAIEEVLGPACPFKRGQPMGLYLQQESWKVTRGTAGGFHCGKCGKNFKSEYLLDSHLDRHHSNERYILPDSYRGGVPTEVVDLKTNTTIALQNTTNPFTRWGECLEEYCAIFDVCDRPPNRSTIVTKNSLSLTAPSDKDDILVASSNGVFPVVDGVCDSIRLEATREMCHNVINRCFLITSPNKFVRAGNIHAKVNLCGALDNCNRYITRRNYAGSRGHYTEGAYTGVLFKPLSSMSGWQIALIVVAAMTFIFGCIAALCCMFEAQEFQPARKRQTDASSHAYRSALDLKFAATTTRRRGANETARDISPTSGRLEWQQSGPVQVPPQSSGPYTDNLRPSPYGGEEGGGSYHAASSQMTAGRSLVYPAIEQRNPSTAHGQMPMTEQQLRYPQYPPVVDNPATSQFVVRQHPQQKQEEYGKNHSHQY